MSIPVVCTCGSQFAAEPHLVGQIVNCPNCRQRLQIPAVHSSPVAVSCQCGQSFRADPSLTGPRVPCPSCGRTILIPQSAPTQPAFTPPATTGATVANYGATRAQAGKKQQLIIVAITVATVLLVGVGLFATYRWWTAGDRQTVFNTPEEVYRAYTRAKANRNWKRMLSLMSPDSANEYVVKQFFEIARDHNKNSQTMAAVAKFKIRARLIESGVTSELLDKVNDKKLLTSQHRRLALQFVGSLSLEKKEELLSACKQIKADITNGKDEALYINGRRVSDRNAKLKNIDIEGDRATADAMIIDRPSLKYSQTVTFVRIDGTWLIGNVDTSQQYSAVRYRMFIDSKHELTADKVRIYGTIVELQKLSGRKYRIALYASNQEHDNARLVFELEHNRESELQLYSSVDIEAVVDPDKSPQLKPGGRIIKSKPAIQVDAKQWMTELSRARAKGEKSKEMRRFREKYDNCGIVITGILKTIYSYSGSFESGSDDDITFDFENKNSIDQFFGKKSSLPFQGKIDMRSKQPVKVSITGVANVGSGGKLLWLRACAFEKRL